MSATNSDADEYEHWLETGRIACSSRNVYQAIQQQRYCYAMRYYFGR